jgi:FKBP-type peptidyl-prolyl cis-trans isomerase SlyD
MQITDQKHVTCDFTLTSGDGRVIGRSTDDDQLTYVHGQKEILPGLETALTGKDVGDRVEVTLPPDEAFGARDDALVHQVPRERFPPGADIQPGMLVTAKGPDGEIPMHVVQVSDQVVVVDENHPLAGVTLHFDVTVRQVRDATAAELTED